LPASGWGAAAEGTAAPAPAGHNDGVPSAPSVRDLARRLFGPVCAESPATAPAGGGGGGGEELPIAAHRQEIVGHIERSQVTIVTGETGSGKTTQVRWLSPPPTPHSVPLCDVTSAWFSVS